MLQLSRLEIKASKPDPIDVSAPDQLCGNEENVIEAVQLCMEKMQQHQFSGEDFALTILNHPGSAMRRFYAVRAKSKNHDLVLKINFGGTQNIKFQRELLAQRRLFEHFKKFPDLHVPEIVFAPEHPKFFVMEYVQGAGVHDALRNHILPQDEDLVFHQTGLWLAKIHALRATEIVKFSPDTAQRTLNIRMAGPEAKQDNIYQSKKFGYFRNQLRHLSGNFEGKDNPVVLGHGDFHGDNLVYAQNGCTGLDFFNMRRLSAGQDIARFLVHAGLSQYEDSSKIGPLGLVQSHVDAFFDGYGIDFSEDHVFNFFIKLRLLEMWSKFPAHRQSAYLTQSILDLMVQRTELAFAE